MNLGKAHVFISYDWLEKHNPEIEWQKAKIKFTRCPESCGMKNHEFQTRAEKDMPLEEGESILLVDFGEVIDLRLKSTPLNVWLKKLNRVKNA